MKIIASPEKLAIKLAHGMEIKKQPQRNNGTTPFSRCFRRFVVVPILVCVS